VPIFKKRAALRHLQTPVNRFTAGELYRKGITRHLYSKIPSITDSFIKKEYLKKTKRLVFE
jgi:hypothetical protein